MMQKNSSTGYRAMATAAFWLSLLTILSKVLGFGREMALGAVFGISYQTDAYLVAMSVPTVLFSNFFGPLQATTIPVYTRYLQEGKTKARALAGSLFCSVAFLSLASATLGFIFAPHLVRILAPKFSGETYALTVELARIMIPAIPFVALAPVITAFFHSHRSFLVPAAVGFPFNVILIFAILYFGSRYGITAVAMALVIALASQLLILFPGLFRLKIIKWGNRDFDYAGVKEIFILTVPVLIGLIGNDINLLVDRILASGLPEGSIAALGFASRLNSMPHALFGVTVLTVFYPQLSRLAVDNKIAEFRLCIERAAAAILFLLLPATVGLLILRRPIIQVLFERAAFDEYATSMTSIALLYYSLSLIAWALSSLVNRAFYSFYDTKTPVKLTFISVAINIILSLLLVRYMAHAGLALATSIAAITAFLVGFYLFLKKIGGLDVDGLLKSSGKIAGAASIMGLLVWFLNARAAFLWSSVSDARQAAILFVIILCGLLVYLLCSYFFGVKEIHYYKVLLQEKISNFQKAFKAGDKL